MAKSKFKSIFADEIQNYADNRQAAGYNSYNTKMSLSKFDRFCCAQELREPVFTRSVAEEWL